MAGSWQDEWASALRSTVPLAFAVLLTLAMLAPAARGAAGYVMPHLTLMFVYYWTIHRPALLPPPVTAGIGLLQDLLWGSPLGLTVIVLLLTQAFLVNQQALFTRRSFIVGWFGFGAVTLVAMTTGWFLASAYSAKILPATPVVIHALSTIAAYPLAGWIFGWLQRAVLD